MSKNTLNIIIVESSHIICEGILCMLNKAGQTLNIHTSNNLCELQQLNLRFKADVIIINPSYIQQNLKHFYS